MGFEAMWMDRAVMHFGQAVEADIENSMRTKGHRRKPMSEAMRNQKVAEVMARWMGVQATERKFKDPAMKLREW
jgi:hypothetical protein